MTGELVTQAARREVLASTLGRLVLAEPGPGLDELVGTMVDLEALTDAATAVDYERIFLRAAPPYESLFCSADGHQGGLPAAAVAAVYGEAEFTEHDDGGWRVAGPDHLGLELRFHAHLVGRELLAWRADRPDEAAVAIETQRRFLAEHMARWAAVAVRALQPAAVGTPYAVVLELVTQFLAEEADRLRPAPLLGPLGPLAGEDGAGGTSAAPGPASSLGPARLTRHLLAPGRSGIWLGPAEIGAAATRLGFPWRPMDGRGRLRQLVEAAADAGELAPLLDSVRAVAVDQAAWYRGQAVEQEGLAAVWSDWAARAEATANLLAAAVDAGLQPAEEQEVVLRVLGPGITRAAPLLEAAGFTVSTVDVEADAGD